MTLNLRNFGMNPAPPLIVPPARFAGIRRRGGPLLLPLQRFRRGFSQVRLLVQGMSTTMITRSRGLRSAEFLTSFSSLSVDRPRLDGEVAHSRPEEG